MIGLHLHLRHVLQSSSTKGLLKIQTINTNSYDKYSVKTCSITSLHRIKFKSKQKINP